MSSCKEPDASLGRRNLTYKGPSTRSLLRRIDGRVIYEEMLTPKWGVEGVEYWLTDDCCGRDSKHNHVINEDDPRGMLQAPAHQGSPTVSSGRSDVRMSPDDGKRDVRITDSVEYRLGHGADAVELDSGR